LAPQIFKIEGTLDMSSDIYSLLRQAISDMKQVTCTYQGFYREICPHVIGTKRGREQVLGFQFGGQSSTGLPAGGNWRCMRVAEIQNAAVRDGPWHTGTTHTRPQTCVNVIDVEVPY
jgi:hypothetical protein